MKLYKVWIDIEEYDEETQEGEVIPLMHVPSVATFARAEDARAFAEQLQEAGRFIIPRPMETS